MRDPWMDGVSDLWMAPHWGEAKDFVLFTSRYGINRRSPAEHFGERHVEEHRPSGACEVDERFRCRCSGGVRINERPRCCARMTSEDLRCDECREWCYAVRGESERVDYALEQK